MSYTVMEGSDFTGKGLDIGSDMQLEQVFDWQELACCEKRNRYRGTSAGQDYFIAEDTGDCLVRNCCAQARPTTLRVHLGPTEEGPEVTAMHKPFMCVFPGCQFLCCGEPELRLVPPGLEPEHVEEAYDASRTGVVLRQPCAACCGAVHEEVFTGDTIKYDVVGNACCRMPPCCDLELDIKDHESGEEVGHMTFHAQTCLECCKNTNRFDIDFPEEAGPNDKAALVGAAFLVDLWVESQNDDNGGGS